MSSAPTCLLCGVAEGAVPSRFPDYCAVCSSCDDNHFSSACRAPDGKTGVIFVAKYDHCIYRLACNRERKLVKSGNTWCSGPKRVGSIEVYVSNPVSPDKPWRMKLHEVFPCYKQNKGAKRARSG